MAISKNSYVLPLFIGEQLSAPVVPLVPRLDLKFPKQELHARCLC